LRCIAIVDGLGVSKMAAKPTLFDSVLLTELVRGAITNVIDSVKNDWPEEVSA